MRTVDGAAGCRFSGKEVGMIRNHATENGYHYKISLQEDGKFHIDCVDEWVYSFGQYYTDRAQLYKTLHEALKTLTTTRRTIVMPDGTKRNNQQEADVFVRWHPTIRELWPGEY